MKRKDKLKLLRDIAEGRKTISETLPSISRIWECDENAPEILYCKKEGLTKRKGEILPDEKGRDVISIIIVRPKKLPPSACNLENDRKTSP